MRVVLLFVLAVVALGSRLWQLDVISFDHDEMATAAWVYASGWRDLYQQLWGVHEGNALGFPFLIHAWGFFSRDPTWLRIPSVFFGTCTVLLFFWSVSARGKILPAFFASLLLALSASQIWASQNARVYALYAFVIFAGYLSLENFLVGKRRLTSAISFGCLMAISFYLHHVAFFYFAALTLAYTWGVYKDKLTFWYLLAPAAALLLYLPQVPLLFFQVAHGPRWIHPITSHWFGEMVAELFWLHHWLPTLALAALAIWGAIACWKERRWAILVWVILPILGGAAFSFFLREIFATRYFLPTSVGIFALAAVGLGEMAARAGIRWDILASGVILLFAAADLPKMYSQPRGANFKGAAEFLKSHQRECGSLVLTDPLAIRRWPVYLGKEYQLKIWGSEVPQGPYWILSANFPLPPYIESRATKNPILLWRGNYALAACVAE